MAAGRGKASISSAGAAMPLAYDGMSRAELIKMLRRLEADPRLKALRLESARLSHDLEARQIDLETHSRELREAQELLEDSRDRYAGLYNLAPVAHCTLDSDGRIQEANLTAASLFGLDREFLLGRLLSSIVSVADPQVLRSHLKQCFTQKVLTSTGMTLAFKDRGWAHLQMVSSPVLGPDGSVKQCKTALMDISDLKGSETRLRLLAKATEILASSFDYVSNLKRVALLTVPALADVCVVDLLDDPGQLRRVETVVADPDDRQVADALRRLEPRLDGEAPQAEVVRAGKPILFPECAALMLGGTGGSTLELEAFIKACNAKSVMFVPVTARGRTVGVMSLAISESQRRYSPTELVLAQDLAFRVAMAIESARLYQVSQRAILARDDVLSIVAHDLRSPLGSIMLSANSLLSASPQPDLSKVRKHAETIRCAADRIDRMIGDLLDASSVESGHLAIETGEQDINELIGGSFETLSPRAKEKNLELKTECSVRPLRVVCDRDRIFQVLGNLIGNAIKFTPEGGTLAVSADSRDGMACVAVRDTGPGIPDAVLPHLFERYCQAKETAREGRGLGLFIAKGIVEAQGGTIWVESEVGVGTTFFFSLPLA